MTWTFWGVYVLLYLMHLLTLQLSCESYLSVDTFSKRHISNIRSTLKLSLILGLYLQKEE